MRHGWQVPRQVVVARLVSEDGGMSMKGSTLSFIPACLDLLASQIAAPVVADHWATAHAPRRLWQPTERPGRSECRGFLYKCVAVSGALSNWSQPP